MTDTTTPEIPDHLVPDGRAVFASAVEEFELSIPERAALLQAAETIDTLRTLERSIRATGVVNPAGRANPLLPEARQQRATLVRLLGLLDLRLDDDEDGVSPAASRAGRAAARARHSRPRGRGRGRD